MKKQEDINFTTSAAIANRLGNELIRNPETAFFELIKNSYDADSTQVEVKFHRTEENEGKIIIRDNGDGMSFEDLKDKWARAGGENKVREPYTPKLQRRRLGAKGIGRFSAAKIGKLVKIITRTPHSTDQLSFRVDFKEFNDRRDLGDISLPCDIGVPRKGFTKGTILEISELCNKWGKREIKKVRSQLCHLIAPDKKESQFKITIDCPKYQDLTGVLTNPITGKESHIITFKIDVKGNYKVEVVKNGKIVDEKKENRTSLISGPVEGVIRYYKEGLKARDRSLTKDQSDESHMGIKVYRDDCRVRPYGEEDDDWLGIKADRAKAGGKYYIHPRTIAGAVFIKAKDNPELIDATNREAGIFDNDEFHAFKNFVKEHVDMLNKLLEQEVRSESQKTKRQTFKKILDTIINCLKKEESDIYKDYINKLDRTQKGKFGQTSKKKNKVIIDVKKPTKEEWHCVDCDERWRVIKGKTPRECLEFAVNRIGAPRKVEGCGSKNIQRARHQSTIGDPYLTSIVSGEYAIVDGKIIRARIDYDMGHEDEEFLVDKREIVINGNHPVFSVAQHLDKAAGKKFEFEGDTLWPAQTLHVTKCACLAWAELHYKQTQDWDQFKDRYDSLQTRIYERVRKELAF